MKKRIAAILLGIAMLFSLCACAAEDGEDDVFTAAIMLPGVQSENATFDMYVKGIQKALDENGSPELKVIEGGASTINYSRYLKELAESEEYDVVFTCTNTVTSILLDIAAQYPDQKFAIVKGDLSNLTETIPSNIYAVEFDSYEEGFLGGYFCSLVTGSDMPRANAELAVGVMFPSVTATWQEQALPGFKYGAELANPDVTVHCLLVNSWTDITKGQDIARALMALGVDTIWYSTGASCYGAVLEAQDKGCYAVASDHNAIDFDAVGETIVGCNITDGTTATYKVAKEIMDGSAPFGTQEYWGAKESVITFTWDDPVYLQYVPEEIRNAMSDIYAKMQSGEINVREYIKAHPEYIEQLDDE